MSTITHQERAGNMNGVEGKFFGVVTAANGIIRNQKFISQRRPIDGWGAGATIQAEARFDDQCNNGHESFAITAEIRRLGRRDCEAWGCLHDEIAKAFPELAPLINFHLVSTDSPIHYVANTLYHAEDRGMTHAWVYYTGPSDPLGVVEPKERLLGYLKADKAREAEGQPGYRLLWDANTAKARNLAHARSSACWPEATDEQLSATRAELEAVLIARLPALMAEFKAAMIGAGFVWPNREGV